MKLIALIFAFSGFTFAQAQAAPATAAHYQCRLIVVAADIPQGKGDWQFQVNAKGASHGGDGQTFKEGTHEIYVSADSHWMVIDWMRSGKSVARGLFAMSPTDFAANRVAILYQPDESGDQVSVGCDAVTTAPLH